MIDQLRDEFGDINEKPINLDVRGHHRVTLAHQYAIQEYVSKRVISNHTLAADYKKTCKTVNLFGEVKDEHWTLDPEMREGRDLVFFSKIKEQLSNLKRKRGDSQSRGQIILFPKQIG